MEKYSFWVHLLLEGELESGKEAEIFEALAKYPELREEFRHLVLMNRSLREQVVRTPPPKLTQTVFDRLFRGKPSIAGSLMTFAGGVVVGVLLSLAIFFAGQWSQPAHSPKAVAEMPDLPVVEFTMSAYSQPPVLGDTAHYHFPVSVVEQGSEEVGAQEVARLVEEGGEVQPKVTGVSPISVPLGTEPLFRPSVEPVPQRLPALTLDNLISPVSWNQLQGAYRETMTMLSNPQIQRLSGQLERPFELQLGYQIAPHHIVGVAVGREPFPQRFYLVAHMETERQREEYDVRVYYEQVPVLWWAGGFYRTQWELFPRVVPFTELLVGGTQVGPLFKATLGTSLKLTDNVALQLGIEGSALLYQVYEKVFATQKLNLIYGLKVGL